MSADGITIIACVFIVAITVMVVTAIIKGEDTPRTTPTLYNDMFEFRSYQSPYVYEFDNRIKPVEGSYCELQCDATNEHSYYTADDKEMLSTWRQKGDHVYDVHVFEKVSPTNWKQLN